MFFFVRGNFENFSAAAVLIRRYFFIKKYFNKLHFLHLNTPLEHMPYILASGNISCLSLSV